MVGCGRKGKRERGRKRVGGRERKKRGEGERERKRSFFCIVSSCEGESLCDVGHDSEVNGGHVLSLHSGPITTNVSDVFFPQLSNDVGSFSEIFHFDLQKLFRILFLTQKTSRALFGKYPSLRKKCSAFNLEGKKKNIKNTLFEI